uniref:NADH-ubiquinone oxidoreductase chain 5 n=1 Tax=Thylacodes squamigerus TaxID=766170 RepID=E2FLU7_9CAEN|nr:NADH dehydrogenase subunit 5 [Thylacodes squamigerus]ADI79413.1 NADH dehydrogenase subunit 5 [Thylacodes squamigerus]
MKLKISSISSFFLFSSSLSFFFLSLYFSGDSIMLQWDILSISSCTISLNLLLDGISFSFGSIVCMISACVMVFSSSYMANEQFLKRFIYLVLLFVLSMNFLIFIPSLPALLIGWDGLGIVSFALVIYYQNNKSLAAGLLTILMNRVGDVMILLAIGVLVLQGHWLINSMWEYSWSGGFALMITIAAMTKSAQIPFSSWLPAAMAAPTPVSALVHSSTLVTAGVYLLLRFHPFLSKFSSFNVFMLFISVLTLMMAGLAANMETDLKKVIALSTLSQLGVMMLSVALGAVNLTLFHLYTHALFKALLFLCAGSMIHASNHNQDLRLMGMSYSQLPMTVVCLNIANLALCGAPFLSGFYSKDLILESSLVTPTNALMLFCIFVATGLTSAYSFRLSISSLWGHFKGSTFHAKGEDSYIVGSTYCLAISAVASGALLQSFFLEFNLDCFLPQELKLLTPLVILGGLAGAYLVLSGFTSKTSLAVFFVAQMWFLVPLSTQPLAKMSLIMGTNILKSVDGGWLEVVGGQGALVVMKGTTRLNQGAQVLPFNTFVFFILLAIVAISFYYIF